MFGGKINFGVILCLQHFYNKFMQKAVIGWQKKKIVFGLQLSKRESIFYFSVSCIVRYTNT